MIKRSFIREILDAITPEMISFAGGLPDEGLFPKDALADAAQAALQNPASLQYGGTQGNLQLRQAIARRYSEKGMATTPEEILVTTGSQQGITLAALAHFRSGLLVESPLYLGAKGVFEYFGIDTLPVPFNREGIDLNMLAQKGREGLWAYLVPDFHNPTGRRYDRKHREGAAKLLKEKGMFLAEDGAYESLYFDSPMPSIASTIPDHSLHLGSFSKILAPGMRVGWVRGSKNLLVPMIAVKERIDLHTSSLDQAIIAHYLADNDLEAHLKGLRQAYKKKMETMADILEEELPGFLFQRPAGGMFIYGKLAGVDASQLVRECMKEGVVFVPGVEFGDPEKGSIRFNFSHADPERIRAGMRTIRRIAETRR